MATSKEPFSHLRREINLTTLASGPMAPSTDPYCLQRTDAKDAKQA